MPANHTDLEERLWSAADEFRANSKLKSTDYSVPVLSLLFPRSTLTVLSVPNNILHLRIPTPRLR